MMDGVAIADTRLGPVRITPPGATARTRAGLSPGVRAKLDILEREAADQLALSRAAGERANAARSALTILERRIADSMDPYRPPAADLESLRLEQADLAERVGRLATEREEITARWQQAGQLAERRPPHLRPEP